MKKLKTLNTDSFIIKQSQMSLASSKGQDSL